MILEGTVASKIILACWLVFVAYWVISLAGTKRTIERPALATQALHRLPLALGAWLLFGSGWLARTHPSSFWSELIVPHSLVFQIISAGLCVLGLLGAIWSRRTIAGNWSGNLVLKESHELVQKGPYGLARHPIYSSMLLMAFATAIAIGRVSSLTGFLLVAVGLVIRLKLEEDLMLKHFPSEYPAYKTRVKALIPFIW